MNTILNWQGPRGPLESGVKVNLMQRLRDAGLRATTARIAVLQAIEAVADGISAEEVFRQLPGRGARASISTVYRVIHEYEQAGIVQREWDDRGTAFYRLQSTESAASLELFCNDCRRTLLPANAELHARLLATVRSAEPDLAASVVTVHLGIAGCSSPKNCIGIQAET